MNRNLDTSLLRSFVSAAETGSMTTAANTLHITQGAVSQQIRRLEENFGCVLFRRGRRGLRLTDAGERLFGKAKRLLGLNDEIWTAMTARDVAGEIRFGTPADLVGTHLPPVLSAFARSHPQVDLSLVCAPSPQLADELAAGRLDLALVEEPLGRSAGGRSAGECLSVERLAWFGGTGGEAHLKRPLPLSIVSDGCAFRPAILAALRGHGLEWKTVFESGNAEATVAAARMDLAVTAWLASAAPPGLEILPPEAGLPDLPSFAVNLHVAPSGVGAAAQELVRHLRETFRKAPRDAG
jgi:DNA-binding transcriptional LysR family regulator